MNEMIRIEVIKKFQQYNVGDLAGFPPHLATKLVVDGYVRIVAPIASAKAVLENRVQRKVMTK
jgi:hypothetical protein